MMKLFPSKSSKEKSATAYVYLLRSTQYNLFYGNVRFFRDQLPLEQITRLRVVIYSCQLISKKSP